MDQGQQQPPQLDAAVPEVVANAAAQSQQQQPDGMSGVIPTQTLAPVNDGNAVSFATNSSMPPGTIANGQPIPPAPEQNAISADEIALYDRQIRLWGMAAQAKIQGANVLLINMRALANEVAKNLVLAGIGSLTILDSARVTEVDLGAQFFQSDGGESHVGKNRAEAASEAIRKLNARVQVHVDAEGVKSKGPSYFAGFDIVIATDLDTDSFNLINTATRINGKPFYAAGTHGMYGFIFSDLIEHDYIIERDVGNVETQPKQETRTRSIINVSTKKEGGKTTEVVTKRELYSTWFLASDVAVLPEEYLKSKRRLRSVSPALPCLRALWEFMSLQGGRLPQNRDDLKLFTQIATQKVKALSLPSESLTPEFLRSFLQNLGSEIAPVTAVLGGQLAQDVINVLGQKQQPIQNTAIFDGNTMESQVYALHPEGNLGSNLLSLGDTAPGAAGTFNTTMGVVNSVGALQMLPQGTYDPNLVPPTIPMLDAGGVAPEGFPMTLPFVPHGAPLAVPEGQSQQQPPAPTGDGNGNDAGAAS